MVFSPLDDILETVRSATQEKQYTFQMAQSLAPLRNHPAFKVFLDTIRLDLEGVTADMASVVSSIDAAPKLFECRALMHYQTGLLERVDKFLAEAQAITDSTGSDGNASEE